MVLAIMNDKPGFELFAAARVQGCSCLPEGTMHASSYLCGFRHPSWCLPHDISWLRTKI